MLHRGFVTAVTLFEPSKTARTFYSAVTDHFTWLRIISIYWMTLGTGIAQVSIEIGYWLDIRGFVLRVPVLSRIVSSLRRPDSGRLWVPSSRLYNGHYGLFLLGVNSQQREVKKFWSIHPLPHTSTRLSAWLSIGSTLFTSIRTYLLNGWELHLSYVV
jgi:hypothetical protein